MTLKEAILKALEDLEKPVGSGALYEYLLDKQYWPPLNDHKTPRSSVAAALGDFIRNKDSRVLRHKPEGQTFLYFLSKHADQVDASQLESKTPSTKSTAKKSYKERDLHQLFSTYLDGIGVQSKTIYHEASKNSKDPNQKWIHPDLVGVQFIRLKSDSSNRLLRTTDSANSFDLYSYELKRTINNDYELKKAYFQAVSNSYWANYGYLVAFEISDTVKPELKRLNQSFGIGIIQLAAYPHESQVLFSAQHRDLDFSTIDKICMVNDDFKTFIDHIDKVITAKERYRDDAQKTFKQFCDQPLEGEAAITAYCQKHHIPTREDLEELTE